MSEPLPIEALLAMPVSEGRSEQHLGEMTLAAVDARAAELGASALRLRDLRSRAAQP